MERTMRMLLGTGHVVAGLLLLPGWLIVDLDDSWSLVPDQVPDALLLAVDRGVGAWELPGVGVVLILAWLGAAAGLGLALRTKRSGWLLVSGLLSTVAGLLGVATIGLLLVASVAIGLLVPSDWDAFDPDVRVGWAAYAFVVGSGANAVAALIMWFRRASRFTADRGDAARNPKAAGSPATARTCLLYTSPSPRD